MAKYSPKISSEVTHLKRSVMRDLLATAVDPDILSMAGGLPNSDLIPVDDLRQCVDLVLSRDGARAFQYGPQREDLKRWIVEHMRAKGAECELDEVFITNGAQQGLAILSRLFLDPGDPAVIEEITFTGIQQVTVGRGATIRTARTDLSSGIEVDDLEEAFARGPRPRLAVVIPDFHNPLGVSISAEKRERIAALAGKYQVPVIEDDPYSSTRFTGQPIPPIKAFDEAGFVFYIGSFSKALAPGMRLGWIVAPRELLPKITVVRESLDLETSTFIQRVVTEYLLAGKLEGHLERMRIANGERCEAVISSLQQELSELATWTQPEGGLFVWVSLPESIDTWELFDQAVERKVAFIPGGAFSVNGGHANTMRLNFANLPSEKIREGITRVADCLVPAG
jgi:2-aminoadipate transaminase